MHSRWTIVGGVQMVHADTSLGEVFQRILESERPGKDKLQEIATEPSMFMVGRIKDRPFLAKGSKFEKIVQQAIQFSVES